MAITRMAIAREIPPPAAWTAPRNEAHQLSGPKFRRNRYAKSLKLSDFIALLSLSPAPAASGAETHPPRSRQELPRPDDPQAARNPSCPASQGVRGALRQLADRLDQRVTCGQGLVLGTWCRHTVSSSRIVISRFIAARLDTDAARRPTPVVVSRMLLSRVWRVRIARMV